MSVRYRITVTTCIIKYQMDYLKKKCARIIGFVMLHVVGLFCHVITVVQIISFSM